MARKESDRDKERTQNRGTKPEKGSVDSQRLQTGTGSKENPDSPSGQEPPPSVDNNM